MWQTTTFGGFLKWRYPHHPFFSMDFPWNSPSSYWGTTIYGNVSGALRCDHHMSAAFGRPSELFVKTCQIPSLCKNQNDKSQVHLWILMIYLWFYFQCFDWAWKKSPTTRQLQEACFNSEEAKTEMAAISGRDPSEFKARSTSETMAKNRMWWVKCPRSPQKCVLSLCLYTYIHTYRQTDGRTDRHTYIHTYDIGLCVLCVLCMLCFYAAFNVFKRR